jgi:hypothetical protein
MKIKDFFEDEELFEDSIMTMLASEEVLKRNWLSEEDNFAWKYL